MDEKPQSLTMRLAKTPKDKSLYTESGPLVAKQVSNDMLTAERQMTDWMRGKGRKEETGSTFFFFLK